MSKRKNSTRLKARENIEDGAQFSVSLERAELEEIQKISEDLGISRSAYVTRASIKPWEISSKVLNRQPKDLPQLLQFARVDYQAALERNGDRLRDTISYKDYATIVFPYSEFKEDLGLLNFQSTISAKAAELPTLGKQTEVRPLNEGGHKSDFDVVRRTGFIFGSRVLYAFPFLLTETRRPFWGIIPYGQHRRIGLYFRKENSIFLRQWQQMQVAEDKDVGGKMPNKVYKWFNDLIKFLMASNAVGTDGPKLYTVEGFVQQELLQLLLGYSGPSGVERKSDYFVYPLHRRELKFGLPFFSSKLEEDVFLFDLADRHDIEPEKQKQIVEMPHGLDIPVGIGFSLNMLPRLLEDENWRQLFDTAMSLVNQENYIANLRFTGIEINKQTSH